MSNMAQVVAKHNAKVVAEKTTKNSGLGGMQLPGQVDLPIAWEVPDCRSGLQGHHHSSGPH